MPAPIKVELIPHSAEWTSKARAESERIMKALGPNILAVHHVGSTAIRSICAKPILDLMPEVQSIERLDAAKPAVQALGYEWWGEYGIRDRRYCTMNDAATRRRLIQLHCFQAGSPEIERHLAFRDYLRARPEEALAYEKEKKRCRDLHPDDSHSYTDAKAAWIDAAIPLALAYCRSKAHG